ncbi:methyltransferase [Nocardiopsis sediminis]|uniref:Methyltransferase n=1 Tax=Nocardiopsis sediminis TaxID=1778267 RepID=A0ABV8FQT8_9ACTN
MDSTTEITTSEAGALVELGQGFWAAKTFLTAVELDLFTVLAEKPLTEPEVRERLGLHPRATRDFLDALVGLGVLLREDGRYRGSAAAEMYLDKHKPTYIGGRLLLLNWRYEVWGRLPDLLRSGDPQSKSRHDFDAFYRNPEAVKRFMLAMDGANAEIGPALARAFDWTGKGSFVDIGGARGNLAAEIVKAHPHLTGGCLDLPPVEPVFDEHMARLGLADRVTFHPADFFTDPLPETDVMVFGHVLHDWDDENRVRLLRRAYEALPEGGVALVYDALVDDDRRDPANLLRSLSMRLVTPGGSEYTAADCRGWLEAAGFTDVSTTPLTRSDALVVAHKQA